MSGSDDPRHFSKLFDRALVACAEAQDAARRCRESQTRARELHASARRMRALAAETRAAWQASSNVLDAMRAQVESAARAMRADGVPHAPAAAAIRAHMRFVLYDGGLREQEAEVVIAQARIWVDCIYEAA